MKRLIIFLSFLLSFTKKKGNLIEVENSPIELLDDSIMESSRSWELIYPSFYIKEYRLELSDNITIKIAIQNSDKKWHLRCVELDLLDVPLFDAKSDIEAKNIALVEIRKRLNDLIKETWHHVKL